MYPFSQASGFALDVARARRYVPATPYHDVADRSTKAHESQARRRKWVAAAAAAVMAFGVVGFASADGGQVLDARNHHYPKT